MQGLGRHPAGTYVLLALRAHPLTERRGNPTPTLIEKARGSGRPLGPKPHLRGRRPQGASTHTLQEHRGPRTMAMVWTHSRPSVGLGGPARRLRGLSPSFASLGMQLITLSLSLYLVAKAIRGLGYFCSSVTHIPVSFCASAINNNCFPCTEAPSLGREGSGSPPPTMQVPVGNSHLQRGGELVTWGSQAFLRGQTREGCEVWAGEGAAHLLTPRRTESPLGRGAGGPHGRLKPALPRSEDSLVDAHTQRPRCSAEGRDESALLPRSRSQSS